MTFTEFKQAGYRIIRNIKVEEAQNMFLDGINSANELEDSYDYDTIDEYADDNFVRWTIENAEHEPVSPSFETVEELSDFIKNMQ